MIISESKDKKYNQDIFPNTLTVSSEHSITIIAIWYHCVFRMRDLE